MPKSKPSYKRKMKLKKREQNTYKWAKRKAASMTDEERSEFILQHSLIKNGIISDKEDE